jgi:porin
MKEFNLDQNLGANAEACLTTGIAVFGRYGVGTYRNTAFDDATLNYWMAGASFPDLFKQGAIAGIAAGQPIIASEIGNATQTNFEAFYNFPITDAIRITPTLQVITEAGNQDANGTIVTGTVRTIFLF